IRRGGELRLVADPPRRARAPRARPALRLARRNVATHHRHAGRRRPERLGSRAMTAPVSFDLTGDVALVTGGTSGFGLHFAETLSAAGATVVLTGRRVDRLRALEQRIVAGGGRAHALVVDVRRVDSMRACIEEA